LLWKCEEGAKENKKGLVLLQAPALVPWARAAYP